jgi:hypothetical protein
MHYDCRPGRGTANAFHNTIEPSCINSRRVLPQVQVFGEVNRSPGSGPVEAGISGRRLKIPKETHPTMSDSISSVTGLYAPSTAQNSLSPYQKIKADMQALSAALQSGNLSSAQSAYATLEKDAPNLAAASQSASTTNPRAQALAALGTALQSGNLSQAQQAFNNLQQAMQGSSSATAAVHGHHHHHHHASGSSTDPTAVPTSSNSLGNLFLSSSGNGTATTSPAGSVFSAQA